MNLSERIHEIKNKMRKRMSDEELLICVDKLLKIENEIRRNVIKAIRCKNHKLHFNSGDLRIIATCINTKMTKFQKKLYYETIDNDIMSNDIINDTIFDNIINKSICDYKIFQKISDCHYLLGTITPTVKIIEKMREI